VHVVWLDFKLHHFLCPWMFIFICRLQRWHPWIIGNWT
jgi:hypothetical protein